MSRASSILVVEDNPDDEALMLRLLGEEGYGDAVTVTRNGQEALDYLLHCRRPPRLILLDLKLPRLGGLEVLQALRVANRTRLLPVVVFTSSMERTDVVASFDLGANSYICKPVDYDEFKAVMKVLLEYWMRLNTPAAQ